MISQGHEAHSATKNAPTPWPHLHDLRKRGDATLVQIIRRPYLGLPARHRTGAYAPSADAADAALTAANICAKFDERPALPPASCAAPVLTPEPLYALCPCSLLTSVVCDRAYMHCIAWQGVTMTFIPWHVRSEFQQPTK